MIILIYILISSRWLRKIRHHLLTKKLLDQVREKNCFKHYSLSTEKTYISWIKHYIVFNGKRHPAEMGGVEVEQFLSYLANERHASSATQNQALSAILFLYREVLASELPWMDGFERSKKPKRLQRCCPAVYWKWCVVSLQYAVNGMMRIFWQVRWMSGCRMYWLWNSLCTSRMGLAICICCSKIFDWLTKV